MRCASGQNIETTRKSIGNSVLDALSGVILNRLGLWLPTQLLVVGVVDGAAGPGPLGKLYFRYGYKAEGKTYAAAERSIDLVLQERITTPAPKELVQGMWFLRVGSAFSDLDRAADALVRFYKDLGFNAIWGHIGPEVYRHAR